MAEVSFLGEVGVDIKVLGVSRLSTTWSDVVEVERVELSPAGSAGYSAMAYARLGGTCRLLGRVGEDYFGRFALDRFREAGVDVQHLRMEHEVSTEATIIFVFKDKAKASLCTQVPVIKPEMVGEEVFKSAKAAHFSGYLFYPNLWGEGIKAILGRAKEMGLHTSLDPQMSITGEWRRPFELDLSFLDAIFMDEGEAVNITGETSIRGAAEALIDRGVTVVLIKRGERGAYIHSREEQFEAPPFKVKPVSTVGAGDVFDAAFLHAYLRGTELQWATRFANLAAAHSTEGVDCVTAIPPIDILMKEMGAFN